MSDSPGQTYAEVRSTVERANGLICTEMAYLRDLEKAGKLGSTVRANISRKLREHGIGHLPNELPRYQEEEVRLYLIDSAVGRVIAAVQRPSEAGDKLLVQLDNLKAQETLQRIRELVGG